MRLSAWEAVIAPEKLRDYVLSPTRPDGRKDEILGRLTGPNDTAGWVRTIWIILAGETVPRLVPLIPWEKS